MNARDVHKEIFRKGSKTYFTSSIFFPKKIRNRVFVLYAFVRTADDFVDDVPQDAAGFYRFREKYLAARSGNPADDPVIDGFVDLSKEVGFKPEWTDAFLRSMEWDLKKNQYNTSDETLEYIYGSAEVIGLFMAAIMELPPESHYFAGMLGRSMQYINFIRDIQEDLDLGRRYLPLENTGLEDLQREHSGNRETAFRQFLKIHTERYRNWQREAQAGFDYIPKRYLIPIKTASDMYIWTAEKIAADPYLLYRKKIKPSKARIFLKIFTNTAVVIFRRRNRIR